MSKAALRLFRVTLVLWEKEDDRWFRSRTSSSVTVLTFETGFESARKFAESAYMEADDTDREEFEWRSSAIEELEEAFTIPKTERVLPRASE